MGRTVVKIIFSVLASIVGALNSPQDSTTTAGTANSTAKSLLPISGIISAGYDSFCPRGFTQKLDTSVSDSNHSFALTFEGLGLDFHDPPGGINPRMLEMRCNIEFDSQLPPAWTVVKYKHVLTIEAQITGDVKVIFAGGYKIRGHVYDFYPGDATTLRGPFNGTKDIIQEAFAPTQFHGPSQVLKACKEGSDKLEVEMRLFGSSVYLKPWMVSAPHREHTGGKVEIKKIRIEPEIGPMVCS